MDGHRMWAALGRIAAVAALAGGLLATGAPGAVALAPPPPLGACLARGSFALQDDGCPRPGFGPGYGPIDGVQVITVARGMPVSLEYSGKAIDFEKPTRQCGSLGCPYNRMLWRHIGTGVSNVSGCGSTELRCEVRYSPDLVGDRGEEVAVVFAQHFDGTYPVGGTAYVLWAGPLVYPARIEAVDTAGTRLDVSVGSVAYAVRAGADPSAARCAPDDWWVEARTGPGVTIPDCVTLPQTSLIGGDDARFEGYLPVDSGTWTVVGDPRGDAGAPLLSRPSPYGHLTVAMGHDDLAAAIVGERRPTLEMDIRPERDEMALGETQSVMVTVSAAGGEAGDLRDLVFDDPAVLGTTEGGPLAVVGVAQEVSAGFTVARGASRTFDVTVQAVAPGSGAIGGAVSGTDDIGGPARAEALVAAIGVGPGAAGGPGAPEPPTITSAAVGPDGADGPLAGAVRGAPGTTVHVALFTAPSGGLDCDRLLEGEGVTPLGSLPAAIGDDGTGTFSGTAALLPRTWVYGVTVAADGVSAAGDCRRVTEATPTLSVSDADATEGRGRKDGSELVFAVELSSPSDSPVRVHVATADGTATAPADYTALSDDVTIPAGQASVQVRVPVVSDGEAEEAEDLTLVLGEPDGAVLDPDASTATGTISDPADRGVGPIDLRGRWSVQVRPAIPGQKLSITIDAHDERSGDWRGEVVDVKCSGEGCVFPLTGTLDGDRMTLTIHSGRKTATLRGTMRVKGGKETATLSGIGLSGTRGTIILTRKG